MKRKVYRKRNSHKKSDMKIKTLSVVLAVCFSVGAGYFTANYIIGPALGLKAQPMSFDFIKEEDNKNKEEIKEEDVKIVQDQPGANTKSGYALQYGSYSNINGAETCIDELETLGITAEIIEKEGSYKVIGKTFETKKEAENAKQQSAVTEDVFITQIP